MLLGSNIRKNDQGESWTDVEHGQLQDSAVGNWLEKHSPGDSLAEQTSKPEDGSPHCSRGALPGGLRLLFLLLSLYPLH